MRFLEEHGIKFLQFGIAGNKVSEIICDLEEVRLTLGLLQEPFVQSTYAKKGLAMIVHSQC